MILAYQLEIDFTLLVGQLILFLALLAFEAVFDLWIAPKLLQNGWLPGWGSKIQIVPLGVPVILPVHCYLRGYMDSPYHRPRSPDRYMEPLLKIELEKKFIEKSLVC